MKALQRPHHFRALGNPEAWLRTVAVNGARSRWRRTGLWRALAARIATASVAPDELGDDALTVLAALRRIPQSQREAVALRYLGDLSLVQIAETLTVRVGTVKARLSRAGSPCDRCSPTRGSSRRRRGRPVPARPRHSETPERPGRRHLVSDPTRDGLVDLRAAATHVEEASGRPLSTPSSAVPVGPHVAPRARGRRARRRHRRGHLDGGRPRHRPVPGHCSSDTIGTSSPHLYGHRLSWHGGRTVSEADRLVGPDHLPLRRSWRLGPYLVRRVPRHRDVRERLGAVRPVGAEIARGVLTGSNTITAYRGRVPCRRRHRGARNHRRRSAPPRVPRGRPV